jgi:hypothetical protein
MLEQGVRWECKRKIRRNALENRGVEATTEGMGRVREAAGQHSSPMIEFGLLFIG